MLWPPDALDFDLFGYHALDLDGDRLVVGTNKVARPNSVHIYRRVGLNWIEEARLKSQSESGFTQTDFFGLGVAVSGNTIAVSAPASEGKVFIYDLQGDGTWLPSEIRAPDPVNETGFGSMLALCENTLVAASQINTRDSVYVFQRSNGQWLQTARLQDLHGTSLAFDGDDLIIGRDFVFNLVETLYFFELHAGSWELAAAFNQAGSSVALEGDTVAASDSTSLRDPDTVTIYKRAGAWAPVSKIQSDRELSPLALHRGRLYAGERFERSQGAIHIFEEQSGFWPEINVLDTSFMDTAGSFVNMGDGPIVLSGDTMVAGSAFTAFKFLSGGVFTFSLAGECATLTANPVRLSLLDGGTHVLKLSPGPQYAGLRYVLAGSLGKTSGFLINGTLIPLQWHDPYFPLSIRPGVLDGRGEATETVVIPPGAPTWLNHQSLHHAFVVLGPRGRILHVSNVSLGAMVNAHLP